MDLPADRRFPGYLRYDSCTQPYLELARIGSLFFTFTDSPSDQIGSSSTIGTFDTRLSAQALRMMALEQSQETMTSSEVIEIVEWVLQEVSDALKNAVTGYLDQQGDWWNGYGTTGREFFRGSLTEDYPLPRHQKDGLQ